MFWPNETHYLKRVPNYSNLKVVRNDWTVAEKLTIKTTFKI